MKKFLLGLLLCGACTPVYLPNSRSVPLFDEAGEVSIDGYASGSGFDLNTGVSVSDHVAIVANATYSKRNDKSSEEYHEHKFAEFGLGYFDNPSDRFHMEFLGGYGRGQGASRDTYTFFTQSSEVATGYYSRGFLQANFAFTPGIVKLGGAIRLSYVNFDRFETTSSTYDQSRSATFAEPTFFIKVGDPIHFNLQAGFNAPMGQDVAFDYRVFHLSLGVGAKLGL